MVATKLDGVAIAKRIRDALKAKIEAIQATDSTFKPSLTIVQGLSCFLKRCATFSTAEKGYLSSPSLLIFTIPVGGRDDSSESGHI